MGRAKYVVELAEEERVRLRSLLRGGKSFVVLLKADEGYRMGRLRPPWRWPLLRWAGFALLKRDWSMP